MAILCRSLGIGARSPVLDLPAEVVVGGVLGVLGVAETVHVHRGGGLAPAVLVLTQEVESSLYILVRGHGGVPLHVARWRRVAEHAAHTPLIVETGLPNFVLEAHRPLVDGFPTRLKLILSPGLESSLLLAGRLVVLVNGLVEMVRAARLSFIHVAPVVLEV